MFELIKSRCPVECTALNLSLLDGGIHKNTCVHRTHVLIECSSTPRSHQMQVFNKCRPKQIQQLSNQMDKNACGDVSPLTSVPSLKRYLNSERKRKRKNGNLFKRYQWLWAGNYGRVFFTRWHIASQHTHCPAHREWSGDKLQLPGADPLTGSRGRSASIISDI